MLEIEKKRILIVDDSESNTLLIQSLFQEKGDYFIDVIRKSPQVKNYLTKTNPDIVLLDLMMPQVSGFEILESIRNDEQKKNIPVIIISAWDNIENIEKAKDLGANEYVKKPINLMNLYALVNTYL